MRPEKRDTDPGVTNPAHVAFDKTFVLTYLFVVFVCDYLFRYMSSGRSIGPTHVGC